MSKYYILLMLAVIVSFGSINAQSITQGRFTSAGQLVSNQGLSLNFTVGEFVIENLKNPAFGINTGLFGKETEEMISLPVTLLDFRLAILASTVKLYWTVAQEKNLLHCEVLKSTDGANFSTAGSVTALGNTSMQHQYDFTDISIAAKTYYRLKFVDDEGKFKLSNILSASPAAMAARSFVYPNPVKSFVNINITSGAIAATTIYIRNSAGVPVITRSYALTVGQNMTSINLNTLPAGTYYVDIRTKGAQTTEAIIKM